MRTWFRYIGRAVCLVLSLLAGTSVARAAQLRPIAERTASKIVTIKDIRRVVLPDVVRVIIELDDEVDFREDRLIDPPRVFVDLPSTKPAPSLIDRTIRFDRDRDPVRQIRIGRHPNSTTRVVLDSLDVTSYSVYPLYSPFRLVIDCVRAPNIGAGRSASVESSGPALLPGRMVSTAIMTLVAPRPSLSTQPATLAADQAPPSAAAVDLAPEPANTPARVRSSDSSIADTSTGAQPAAPAVVAAASTPASVGQAAPPVAAVTTPTAKGPVPAGAGTTAALPAAPPAKGQRPGANGGFSMARQLGLGVTRIVIDPGHGGHDPGAKGKDVTEAEIVLDVALRLEKLLLEVPGVEVVLTRRTDEFIPLQQRTAIANQESADLFLSIHANAHQTASVRGIETYFLNFANNMTAAAVAARENAASGQTMGALPDIVRAIALNNKLDESRNLAAQVQRSLTEKLKASNKGVRDMGVKQAPFLVLIGAAMPSVLAEISFITNPTDAKLLQTGKQRQQIAEALFTAVRRYQNSLKNVMTVAQQSE